MNWHSEYEDSIFDNKTITKQLRYRIDKADNYLDTCCIQYSIKTYKDDYFIEATEYGELDDSINTKYYYDNSGNLENTTFQIYNSFEGALINPPSIAKEKCFKILHVEFPLYTQLWKSHQIEHFLSDYIKEFYDVDCKPQQLYLRSIDENISMEILRSNCHSMNAGTLKLTIKY